MALIGFCGSRSLSSAFAGLVARVVPAAVAVAGGGAVGCAAGADSFVAAAALAGGCAASVSVFSLPGRVARFAGWPGPVVPSALGVSGRSAAVVRSVACVQAVAGAGGAWCAFISSGPCPVGVAPGRSWSSGVSPSGSWSSCALAAGLGLPVFVFWCAGGLPLLPAWSGGSWLLASSGWAAGSWCWLPVVSRVAAGQLSLFS